MRGSGTLRTIIGRPLYGKQKKSAAADEDDLVAPAKKLRKSASGGSVGAGQKSIFKFFAVAAPSAKSGLPQNSNTDTTADHDPPSSCLPVHHANSAPQPTAAHISSGTPGPASSGVTTEQEPSQSQAVQSESRQGSPEAFLPQTPLAGPLLINTRVVGRQHQSAGWPPAVGSELLLIREAHNPVDQCAILVCSIDTCGIRRTHGHLPAAVACHLAPLMDKGEVSIEAQLLQQAAPTSAPAALAAQPDRSSRQSSTRQWPDNAVAIGAGDSTEQPLAAAAAGGSSSGDAPAQQQQQQQQSLPQLQLQVTLCEAVQAEQAAATLSAVDRAVSAGLESLQPGRSSGAMLAAAFEHIMSETRKHDFHLLSHQEQTVLQHMQSLPAMAKALLLRLLLRKRTWFQLGSLAYADVPQPEAAARRLAAVSLLQWDSDPGVDLDSLLQELPVVVLKQVLAGLLPKGHPAVAAAAAAAAAAAGSNVGAANKAALVSSIKANASRNRLQAAIAAAAGPCVTVTAAAATTFARLQLLYFASPGHDLSMFVAVERGAVSYPSYPIHRTRPVFSGRQQVLEYEQALCLAAQVDAALEEGDNDAAWQVLQPALTALHAGAHKNIVWDEACAPMPNPPPRQQSAPAATPAAAACINIVPDHVHCPSQSALKHVRSAPASLGVQANGSPAAASVLEAAPAAADAAVLSVCRPNQSAEDAGGASPMQQQHDGKPSSAAGGQQPLSPADADVQGRSSPMGDMSLGVRAGPSSRSSTAEPDVLDLTQASSSGVSWDTSDTEVEEVSPAAAATAADADAASAAEQAQPAGQHSLVQQQQQQQDRSPAVHRATPPQEQLQAAAANQAPVSQPSAAHTAAEGSPSLSAGQAAAAPEGPVPPLFFARFCAGWVYASLGTVAASLLEKRKAYGDAVELLRLLLGGNACVGRRGDWWARLAINLEHLGRTEDALEAVEAALADAWVRGGDLLGLQRRYLRLGKPPRRWKRPPWATAVVWEPPEVVITARPLNNNNIGTKSRFYAPDNSQVTVEQLALQHYASHEGGTWQGLHCEGGVFATLFTLLLWDVIFKGVPDVFRSPFQTSPLDLDTDAFYPARRTQLDTQLARIADGHAGVMLTAVWSANAGVMARGVNWQRFTQQQLLEICECVGGLGLAAVLRLMAEDHAGAAGGLPDLLLWRPSDKTAKLVEVKGPRDRLSPQQRFWLAHMAHNTMQVEVLKVKEPQQQTSKGTKRR